MWFFIIFDSPYCFTETAYGFRYPPCVDFFFKALLKILAFDCPWKIQLRKLLNCLKCFRILMCWRKRLLVITKLFKNSINNQYTKDMITLPYSDTLSGDMWIGFKTCNLQPKFHMLFTSQVNPHGNIKKKLETTLVIMLNWTDLVNKGMHW